MKDSIFGPVQMTIKGPEWVEWWLGDIKHYSTRKDFDDMIRRLTEAEKNRNHDQKD